MRMLLSIVMVVAACGPAKPATTKPLETVAKVEDKPVEQPPIVVDAGAVPQVERPDDTPVTTVKEYQFEPATRLPEVRGTADYKPLGKPRVLRFALNVWAGWAPIVWANQGAKPGKLWKDAKGNPFQVELVLIDDPVALANTLANGDVHVGWATVDMLPLLIQRLKRDPRTMPRVFQQVDWSNGGDGIVVRDSIKQVGDLRGKTIVLAQNSPSHYFLLSILLDAGLQPSDVTMKFTKDSFQAAAAFGQDRSISAVVSWAPDIYSLTKPGRGNRLLIDTKTANKLIADVWFARADFAKSNPEIVEGLVRGIFDATAELDNEPNKLAVGKLLDGFYGLPAGTATTMLRDAHWTNHAENRAFFLDQNNPTSFARTYNTAALIYQAIRVIDAQVPFDQVVDFSIVKKLGKEARYAKQADAYQGKFAPVATVDVDNAILTRSVTINFFPNSADLWRKANDDSGLYDPNVAQTIDAVAQLAGRFGAARIHIGGHSDSSMRGVADEALVIELSTKRATAVKQALVDKYKLDPNKFVVTGYGWGKPADPSDPDNHAKNRRVEVKVVPVAAD